MAKLYKVRKKCMICGNVFYPRYAGSLYCEDCKNRKAKEEEVKQPKKTVKPVKAAAKPVKKAVKAAKKKQPAKTVAKKPAKK
jgi:uncharacterized Zn finger protein (UPF0148 family)